LENNSLNPGTRLEPSHLDDEITPTQFTYTDYSPHLIEEISELYTYGEKRSW
jgi:hypothetical protein